MTADYAGLPIIVSPYLPRGRILFLTDRIIARAMRDLNWWLWLDNQRQESARHIDALCRAASERAFA